MKRSYAIEQRVPGARPSVQPHTTAIIAHTNEPSHLAHAWTGSKHLRV